MRDLNKKKEKTGKKSGRSQVAHPPTVTSSREENVLKVNVDEDKNVYSRRAVISNWNRYEDESDANVSAGADFSQLLLSSGTVNSEYQFRNDGIICDIDGSGGLKDFMSIDCDRIAVSLKCIDLPCRLQLDYTIFEDDQLMRFKQIAEECKAVCSKLCVPERKSFETLSRDLLLPGTNTEEDTESHRHFTSLSDTVSSETLDEEGGGRQGGKGRGCGTAEKKLSPVEDENTEAAVEGCEVKAATGATAGPAGTACSDLNVGGTESIQLKSRNGANVDNTNLHSQSETLELSAKQGSEKSLEELEDDLDSLLSI